MFTLVIHSQTCKLVNTPETEATVESFHINEEYIRIDINIKPLFSSIWQ